jgi:hypothetical protein
MEVFNALPEEKKEPINTPITADEFLKASRKLHIDSSSKPVALDAQLCATIRSHESSKAHGNSSWRRARIRMDVRSCETVYDLISSSRFSVCVLDYVPVFKVRIAYPELTRVPRDSTTVEGVVGRAAGANTRPPIGKLPKVSCSPTRVHARLDIPLTQRVCERISRSQPARRTHAHTIA